MTEKTYLNFRCRTKTEAARPSWRCLEYSGSVTAFAAVNISVPVEVQC